jgi:hypothetical protein
VFAVLMDKIPLCWISAWVDGEIISTPSHSNDSISIILDNIGIIVGDIEPYNYIDIYKDNAKLKEDWDKINSYNPKCIYYSHH